MNKETKKERFERIAEARKEKILDTGEKCLVL